ncbi:MAG: hypothetical protein ALAOOOJD_01360 [bacterium]|nr:hypothetical protein [bacterium]
MWIFCCGMQRSGSTLQFQITARLVEEAGVGKRVEWVKAGQFETLRQRYAAEEGWKVIKTHACSEKMVEEFGRKNAMGVYCYRDLRDAFVSSMRKHDLDFEQLWKAEFLQTCLRQFHKWTVLPRVLISKYETMMADIPGEVARIATHLGLDADAEKCRQIAADYSLERQKARIEEAKTNGKLQRAYGNALYDPHTQLHANHIYSGAAGEWKSVLAADETAKIETIAGDWLVAHGYEIASR